MRPALMVLVDDPVHGVPGVTNDKATAEALLSRVLERAREVARVGRVLLFHPPEAEARLTRMALGFRLWPQEGATPGERFAAAFRQAATLGYDGAVVIGLDVPTIPVELMTEAVSRLEQHHGAIAGDGRGGIALLALQEPQPTLLSGSAKPTYEEVVLRARHQRVGLVELPPHRPLPPDERADFLSPAAR